MLPVQELNIIPLFRCNLNCDFCLYSELRKRDSERVLDLAVLEEILSILKKENSIPRRVAVFGGEITLLEKSYLSELFDLLRSEFPGIAFGVVTNLILCPSWFSELVERYGTHVSTSYEGLRFKKDSELYRMWKSSLEKVREVTEPGVNFVLTKSDSAFQESIKVIEENRFREVYLTYFTIPDYFPVERKRYLYDRYAMTPQMYLERFCSAVRTFAERGISVRGPAPVSYTSVESLEIRPDGSLVMSGPSDEGFPFEKEVTLDYRREGTIVFSRAM